MVLQAPHFLPFILLDLKSSLSHVEYLFYPYRRIVLLGIPHDVLVKLLGLIANSCLNQRKFLKIISDTNHIIVVLVGYHIVSNYLDLHHVVGNSLSFNHNAIGFDHSDVHLNHHIVNKTINFINMNLNYHDLGMIISCNSAHFIVKSSDFTIRENHPHLERRSRKDMAKLHEAHPARSFCCCFVMLDNVLQQHLLNAFGPSTQKGQLLCLLLLLGSKLLHRILVKHLDVEIESSLLLRYNLIDHHLNGKFRRNLRFCCLFDGKSRHIR